jgi:hypothetical protein
VTFFFFVYKSEGMNPEAMARIFKKLMAALGYESYFIQGLSLSLS